MTDNSVVGPDWHVMDAVDAKDPRFGELPPAERTMLTALQAAVDELLACRDPANAIKRMEAAIKQLPQAPTRTFLPLLHQVVHRAIRGLCDVAISTVLAGATTAPPQTVEALDMLLQTFPKVGLEMEVEGLGGAAGKPRYVMTSKLLGVGATARVYLGFDVRTSAVRAVKRLHWQELVRRLPDMERSFNQEISLMMSLNSPNIVKLYDQIRPADGRFVFLIMEYCGGGTLRDLIERHRHARTHLDEDSVRVILHDMAAAMQCLQNQNPKIIHRDLKPDNLLLVDPAKYNVKLADFTLARQVSDASQLMNSYVGTPLYMAPEVLWRQAYTEKADLYSIGVILFELLFGARPFDAQHSVDELRHNVRANDVAFPKGHALSPECHDLLSHLLKKDAHARLSWIEFFNHDFLRKNERKLSNTSLSEPAQAVARLKKELEAAERRAMEAQANEIALKRVLAEFEQRAVSAEASLVSLTNSLAARDRDIARLTAELAAARAALAPAPQPQPAPAPLLQQSPPPATVALEKEAAALRSRTAELTQANAALAQENEALKASVKDVDSKLRNAKIRQAELEVALDAARGQGSEAARKLREDFEHAAKHLADARSRVAALEAELVTSRNQTASATAMVGALQGQVAALERTAADLRKLAGPRASDGAEALLDAALADQEKLTKELADVRAQLAASQKEVATLNGAYEELLKELEKQSQQGPAPAPNGRR